jgi:hypothetical protein
MRQSILSRILSKEARSRCKWFETIKVILKCCEDIVLALDSRKHSYSKAGSCEKDRRHFHRTSEMRNDIAAGDDTSVNHQGFAERC